MKAVLIRFRLAPILALALLLGACSDKALQTAATALEDVATVNDSLTQTVIAEQANGTISEADARVILNGVCQKVAQATIIAANLTKQYTTFPAGTRPQLAPLLQPILDAVKAAIDSGLTGIKNPQTQANVKNSLLTIQTALLTAQGAIGN